MRDGGVCFSLFSGSIPFGPLISTFQESSAMPRAVRILVLLVTAISCSLPALGETPEGAGQNPNPNAVLVLGGGMKHNAHGTLTTNPDGLTFESKGQTTKIAAAALEKVTVGNELRESGGTPATVAKMAIPYGGGRVLSLFAHEKFDTLTVEYRDDRGGYHGLLFNLPKGDADPLQAAIGKVDPRPAPAAVNASAARNDTAGWAIEVEPLNPGETEISQEFLVAAYENLVEQLNKTHAYAAVLRGGDINAASYPKLLILKTDVQKFVHGNEEARAVTTLKGWTKIAVSMQLTTADGRSVLQKNVESNVRFYGDNLRATKTLAHTVTTLAATAQMPQ